MDQIVDAPVANQREQTAVKLTLPGGRAVNPWLVLASLMFGFFMSLLDETVVNIAIPNIQDTLHTDLATVSWTNNAYYLSFAALLVTMGRLADQFGRKRVFQIGMVIFTVGSLLSALAPSIGWLIAARTLQGVGTAALNPVSLAVITAVFPAQERGAAIGIWGAVAGLATAVGPVVGGFLVQNFGWPSIFLLNLPICVVGLVMVYRFVPETSDPHASRTFDLLGMLTLSGGLVALILAIIQSSEWGWTSPATLGMLAAGIAGVLLFVVVELRQREPLFDFSLFRIDSFRSANVTTLLFNVGLQGAFLIFILYLINALGKAELDAAYAAIPQAVAAFIISALSGAILSEKLPPRTMVIIGLATLLLGFYLLTTLPVDAGYLDIAWRIALVGAGMGFVFMGLPNLVLSEVPSGKLGAGSGAYDTFQQVGGALGIALLIAVLTTQISDNTATARRQATAIVQADNQLPQQLRDDIASRIRQAVTDNEAASRQFDFTTLADQGGGQSLKPELARLSAEVAAQFKRAVVDAFKAAWLISIIAVALALLAAFFTRSPKPDQIGAAVASGRQ